MNKSLKETDEWNCLWASSVYLTDAIENKNADQVKLQFFHFLYCLKKVKIKDLEIITPIDLKKGKKYAKITTTNNL